MKLLNKIAIFIVSAGTLFASSTAEVDYSTTYEKFQSEMGTYGWKTAAGDEVVPAVFDEVGEFSFGFCPVKKSGKWGYVDGNGLNITPMRYIYAGPFTVNPNGSIYAEVKDLGGWNFIDRDGVPVFQKNSPERITDAKKLGLAFFYLDMRNMLTRENAGRESLREYAQRTVNNYFSFWYPKGEYETHQDWWKRVTDEKMYEKVEELRSLAAKRFTDERGEYKLSHEDFKLQKYDSDNSTFMLANRIFGAVYIMVPRVEAADFRRNWESAKLLNPEYGIGKNDHIMLKGIEIQMPNGAVYRSDPNAIYDVATDFQGFEISIPGGAAPIDIPPRAILSDVDKNIPENPPQKTRNRFACILVNETYENASKVLFAGEDGYAFSKYCEKTLGIPKEKIFWHKNNSRSHIESAVKDLVRQAKVFPDSEIIFYYVGHGVADGNGVEYLLPTDCRVSDIVNGGYRLKDLYEELGSSKAKLVTVFLDANFSGKERNGMHMTRTKKVGRAMVEMTEATPSGNAVVFRASSGDEASYQYPEKSHGLFTYFLLKSLQESRGNVSYAYLEQYLSENVNQIAVLKNKEKQTVTATPSEDLAETWGPLKMR